MSGYSAVINPGPGNYSIGVSAEPYLPGHATCCVVAMLDFDGKPKTSTSLFAKDLDALILSL